MNYYLQDVIWVKVFVKALVMPLAEKLANVLVELRYVLALCLVETNSIVLFTYFQTFQGCECSDERISPEEFALCASESTCSADCQRRGKATGQCNGWQCECLSNQSRNL